MNGKSGYVKVAYSAPAFAFAAAPSLHRCKSQSFGKIFATPRKWDAERFILIVMDYFCRAASANETSLVWTSKNCQCDWINVIISLFSAYIASLLITFLRWMESSRDPKLANHIFGNHSLRACLTMILFLVHWAEFADAFLSAAPFYVFLVPVASFAVLIALAALGILIERTDHPLLLFVTGSLWAINGGARAFRFVLLCYEGVQISCLRSLSAAFSAGLCFLMAISEFFIVKLELSRKRRLNDSEAGSFNVHIYRHDDVNIFSRATFYWMNSFMRCGYKSPIELSDLGMLPSSHAARQLHERLESIISHYEGEIVPATVWKLFLIFMQPDFCIGGVFKLLGDLASIVGPLGISVVVSFVADEKNKNISERNLYVYPSISELWQNGWTAAFIVFFASIAQSTLSQASTHFVNVKSIHLKVALQSLIYKKSLTLSISSKNRKNSIFSKKQRNDRKSNENIDFGILVNLMSNDTANIMSFFTIAHYIWAIPIKVVAIIFLLYLQLGASAIIGAITTIMILLPLQFLIGRKMSQNVSAISELTDERLHLLSILTEKIELFKLLSWEKYHCNKILKVRRKELKLLDKDSLFWAIITFFTNASSILVSLITFGVHYILSDISLSSYGVFSALALFNQLMVPLFIFPVIIPIITEALVSCRRISEFLRFQGAIAKSNNIHLKEIKTKDKIPQNFAISCKMTSIIEEDELRISQTSNDLKLNINDTHFEKGEHEFKDEVSLENLFKLCPEKDKVNDNSDQNKMNTVKKNSHIGYLPEDLILVIENGEFSWNPEIHGTQLKVKNLEIAIGKIIFILGKVGSGKTSLLSAILGEMPQTNGNLKWFSNIPIAYCPQTPWLFNGTIRENILFGLPFHTRRYDQVISACALKSDIDILPKRDLTEVGGNGINLSGGQRQRIAIARAIYSRAKLIILDDPFSSLDLSTANSIFENGIKNLVRRCKRSVILVTHNTAILEECHSVILMEGGTIKAHAGPNDLNLLNYELRNWEVNNIKNEHTINERWFLTKSLVKFRKNLNNTVGSWSAEVSTINPVNVLLKLAKGNYLKSCEWKLISHDLPLPTDEFHSDVLDSNIPSRRNSVKRKRIGRAISLQDRHIKSPQIIRQYSSPLTTNSNQVFSNRMKQRSNNPNIHPKEFAMSLKHNYNYKTRVSKVVSSESELSDLCNDFDDEILEIGEDYTNKDTEERECGKLKSQIYMKYLKACGFKISLAYLIITLMWQIARVYTDFWLSVWVETPLNYGVLKYLYVYASLSIGTTFFSLMSHGLGQLAGSLARKNLHDSMLLSIFQCSNKLLECTRTGRIFSRFSIDIDIIDKKLATTIQRLMQFFLLCCSAMIINAAITPWFIVIAIPVFLLYYIIQKFYRCSSRELLRIDSSTRTPIFSHFTETLSGLSSIRAFGYEEKFLLNFYAKINLNTNCFLILNSANRWLGIVLDYLGGIIVLLGMVTALIAVELYPDAITPSIVGLAINYTLLVPIYLNWVVKFFGDFEIYLGAVERVNHYINLSTKKYIHNSVQIGAIPSDWPKFGDIKFENVSLKYESSPEPILTELNIHIPPGQKVGICGRSGSGKSTLALSLFNMLEIHKGVIKIDNFDISKIPVNLLRTRGSIIPQDTLLFNGTVRENLDATGSYTDDQIWTAVNEAQLQEIIQNNYSGNLDSEMDAGRSLSGGQKQLFSLARAILRKSSFLIMDEATSNLDKESEEILMSTAQRIFKGRTLIIIAHRLSTILDCDRIIVLEKGKIMEDGVPEFLMNLKSGIFSAMVRASEEGFLVP